MVCGAEAAVLCVSSGGGGAARGRPAHRGGAALVCVATTSKGKRTETRFRESGRFVLGFGSSGRFVTVFSRCKPYQPLPCKWQNRSLCFPRVCHFWVPTMCRPGAGAPTMHACALTVLRLTQSYNITTVYDLALAGASYTRSARHAYIRKRA
jgi:hypothetical protein